MINKLHIVLFVYTVTYSVVIVVFFARCESVPTVYLMESYLVMEQFESKAHPFSSFCFFFFFSPYSLENKFAVLST